MGGIRSLLARRRDRLVGGILCMVGDIRQFVGRRRGSPLR
jgi:hypothetical protein